MKIFRVKTTNNSMEANSDSKIINFSETRLKRFSLKEKLGRIVPFTKSQEPSFQEPSSFSDTSFDWQFYIEYYEDLSDLSYELAHEHWMVFGKLEGRFPSQSALEEYFEIKQLDLPEDFSVEQYLELNPDLGVRFTSKQYRYYQAVEHYLDHGKWEGRLYRIPTQPCQEIKPLSGKDRVSGSSSSENGHQPSEVDNLKTHSETRLIAFYLPQFHPIPENDRWWGKGFTEWTNVSKAQPLFDGHYQPHLPADLGFYDLRLAEVREMQANLARSYGIHGFCYYYYWFAGKRLLNRPLDDVLASKKPDFPFCICWANENWTRRWDGQEDEVLIAQDFSDDQNQAFAESVVPILQDERYIRINGLPLLIIYRADIFPDVLHTIQQWRECFRKHGIGEVYLAVTLTCFSGLLSGLTDPTQLGFDAAVQFAPHEIPAPEISPAGVLTSDFTGKFYNYKAAAINAVSARVPETKVFLSAMPSWDNTARRKNAAHAFLNSNPQDYEFWLRGAIEKTRQRYTGDEQLVFINAWNEWAEGAHLEPDQKHGHDFLVATHQALRGTHTWGTVINLLKHFPFNQHAHLYELLEQLEMRIKIIDRSFTLMQKLLSQKVGTVVGISNANSPTDIFWNLDSLYNHQKINLGSIELQGWVFSFSSTICTFEVRCDHELVVQLPVYLSRLDVANQLSRSDAEKCGFYAQIDLSRQKFLKPELSLWVMLQNGRYIELGTVHLEILEISNSDISLSSSFSSNDEQSLIDQIRSLQLEDHEQRYELLRKLEAVINGKEEYIKAKQKLLQEYSVHHFFERF